jgi:hypothetical protein
MGYKSCCQAPLLADIYYIYVVIDVWSRPILVVEVCREQCGKLAGELGLLGTTQYPSRTERVSLTTGLK